MNVAIDLRSLSSGIISGVENYAFNLLNNLLSIDSVNHYKLFFNAVSSRNYFPNRFVNAKIIHTRVPNRLLNLAFKWGLTSIENLIGDFDIFWMPNLNTINIKQRGAAKLVVSVHDLSFEITPEFYNLKRKLWHKFLNVKKLLTDCDLIFSVSEYTKYTLVEYYKISPNKITILSPGVDSNKFGQSISADEFRRIRNIYGLPGDFLLFLGTLEPRTNLQTLLKAFLLIKNPACLVIAGNRGWKNDKILDEIKRHKKTKRIINLGFFPEKHKATLIKLARALVYPSFFEGFGFQPLEAMAAGTPVIASQVSSLPEVVGKAGLLANPYEAEKLALTIDELLENQNLRKELVQLGLETSARFSWEAGASKILQSFNQLAHR